MVKKRNTVSTTKPSKHRSSNDSYTYNKYSGLVSIKDQNPKPDPSKLVPIKDKNPKDQYEPRYVTARKPQGKSKTEIVPIKTLETPKPGSVSANGGKPRKRKTTNKKY